MRHLQLELRDFRNHRPPNGAHDETHAVCVERVRQLQPSEVSPLVVQDIVRLIVLCPSQDLDKWQTAKRVVKFPSLLEFLGHSSVFALSVCVTVLFYSFYWFRFFFPGVLVGPYLDFAEYTALIDESLFKGAEGKMKSGRAVPAGRKRVVYWKMVSSLVSGPFLSFWVDRIISAWP